MLRWSLLLALILLPTLPLQGCSGSNPCADEWRIKCTCCDDSQKSACLAYMERTHIANLRYNLTDEHKQQCRQTLATFACKNEPALNLREYCEASSS